MRTRPRGDARGDDPRSDANFGRRLAVIGAVAFAVRLVFAIVYEQSHGGPGGDAFYYHWQANAIAKGLGFIEPYAWKCWDFQSPSAAHPPLYSLYLSLFSVFGGTSALVHRIATVVAGTGTVLLVGLAGREWRDARTGLVAAALAAVVPFLWINDALLMSETVFGTAVALVVLTSLRYRRSPSTRRAVWVGVSVALATLARAEALLLVPMLLLPLVVVAHRGATAARAVPRARQAGAALLACLAVLAPWTAYNLSRFERPVLVSTGLGTVLAVANCDTTYYGPHLGLWSYGCGRDVNLPDGATNGSGNGRVVSKIDGVSCPPAPAGLADRVDESQSEVLQRRMGLEYVGNHQSVLVRVLPARVGRTFEVFRPAGNIAYASFVEQRGEATARAAQWTFFAFALVGLFAIRRCLREHLALLEIGAMFGLVVVTSMLIYGNVRFRVPFDVVLTLLVAVPLTTLLDRRRRPDVSAGTAPPNS